MQAAIQQNGITYTGVGQVTAYDPANYYAQVQLLSETDDEPALQTGWIPIGTAWMGNGWGLFAPPNIGDIVAVHFQEGNLQNGFVGMRIYNQTSPPTEVQSGEFWLIHSSGAFIKLTNDHKLSISSPLEVNITAPTVNIGNATVNLGNTVGTLTALLNGLAQSVYNTHTHDISGGGVTLAPNQTMDSSTLTTNVQAN